MRTRSGKTKFSKKPGDIIPTKIRKGDKVIVLGGSTKGRSGVVEDIDRRRNRVFIGGVNTVKKHQKPVNEQNMGGIIDKVMPLPLSRVAFLDPDKNRPTKLGYRFEGEGESRRKVRFSKLTGKTISA